MGTRVHYPQEIKWKAIEMKQAGYTTEKLWRRQGLKIDADQDMDEMV